MTISQQAPDYLKTAASDSLVLLDHALPLVIVFKLSAAWYYPGFAPSDGAPGLELVNVLYLAFCLYGTVRLLFTQPLAILFAEPIYLALLLLAIGTLAFSMSFANSFGMVRTALLFFSACLFLRYRFRPAYLLALVFAILSVLLLVSLAMAIATPLGVMGGFDAGRWRGAFNQKNTLGENAGVAVLVALALHIIHPRAQLWTALAASVSLLCLAMSGSATALAATACAGLVFAVSQIMVWTNIRRQQSFALLLASISLLAIGGVLTMGPVAQMLERDLTFTGRTAIWGQFLYFAEQRPWTGWGWATISTTDAMLPLIRQTLNLPYIQTPHSGYISLLVELGWFGLGLFVLWLGTTLVVACYDATIRRDAIAPVRVALVCGLALQTAFESTSGALPSLWLFLLLASGSRVMVRWHQVDDRSTASRQVRLPSSR